MDEVVVAVVAIALGRELGEELVEVLDEARLLLVDHDRAGRVRRVDEGHAVRHVGPVDCGVDFVREVDELRAALGYEVVVLEVVLHRPPAGSVVSIISRAGLLYREPPWAFAQPRLRRPKSLLVDASRRCEGGDLERERAVVVSLAERSEDPDEVDRALAGDQVAPRVVRIAEGARRSP